EVEEFHAFRRHEDVRRLEIAMDDLFPMCGVEGTCDLSRVEQRLVERQRPLERSTLDVLHDQERDVVLMADVVEPADVLMLERRRGARFSLEPLCELLSRDLEGDAAPETGVESPVDVAHPARAD